MSESKTLEGRKLRYVKLHGGDTFIPGFGSFGNTLPPSNKSVNLDMVHTVTGIYVNVNKGAAETIIPWANVQIATYASEPAPFKLQVTPVATTTDKVVTA